MNARDDQRGPRDANTRDANTRDTNTRDANTRDTNTHDTNTRDTNTRDANTRGANTRDARLGEATTSRTQASLRHRVAPRPLGRRLFLRGALAGTAVALGMPVLDEMLDSHGTALAATGTSLPTIFGVFFWGNGIVHDTWVPRTTGREFVLPNALEAFSPIRDYVTLVTGYSHKNEPPGHIPVRGLALSSSYDPTYVRDSPAPGYREREYPEASIDQIVAAHVAALPEAERPARDWIGAGICRTGAYRSDSSWRRGGTRREHTPRPSALFTQLFGAEADATVDARLFEATARARRSMLDAVLGDARALRDRLGATDRRRLDAHLSALREVEARLQAESREPPGTMRCGGSTRPSSDDFGDGSAEERKQEKHAVMSEVLAHALACDLTRVFSYEWSATQSQSTYWELGLRGAHHEDYSHGNKAAMRRIVRFIMDGYASLAIKLRDMNEGATNLLDRTLMLGTSEHGDASTHDVDDHPYLLVGKANGRIRAGQHHRRAGGPNNTEAPRVLYSAVRIAGVDTPGIGMPGQRVHYGTEPIADVVAL